jgi:hypothetical protein
MNTEFTPTQKRALAVYKGIEMQVLQGPKDTEPQPVRRGWLPRRKTKS